MTHLEQLEQFDIDIVLYQTLYAQSGRLDPVLEQQIGDLSSRFLRQGEFLLLQRSKALDRELDLDLRG